MSLTDLLKWALTAEGLSVSGILLAITGLLLIGSYRRWWVAGWVYDGVVKERDEYRTERDSLRSEAVSELKSEVTRLRQNSETMQSTIEELWDELTPAQRRRTRPRGPG